MTYGSAKSDSSQAGFTLVEIAIVMVISGLLMIPIVQYAVKYIEDQRYQTTKENISWANSSLSVYARDFYPCPSDRALAIDDANYGEGDCSKYTALLAAGVSACSANGGVCVQFAMDNTAANTFAQKPLMDKNGDNLPDAILIGGFPRYFMDGAARIDIPEAQKLSKVFDGWGGKINYAVSETMTHRVPVTNAAPNDRWGVISIQDEFGQNTGGTNGNAIFTVWSAGRNQRGAFSASGGLITPCATSVTSVLIPPATTFSYSDADLTQGMDNENCDQDGTFIKALGEYSAAGNTYYDDFISFNTRASTLLWEYGKDAGGSSTTNVRNLNTNNVGVNTTTPQVKLDVSGVLRAETDVRTNYICNYDGTGCGTILAVTWDNDSTRIKCPSGQVMSGIAEWKSDGCTNVSFDVAPSQTCPPGKFVTGFNTDGSIACTP